MNSESENSGHSNKTEGNLSAGIMRNSAVGCLDEVVPSTFNERISRVPSPWLYNLVGFALCAISNGLKNLKFLQFSVL